MCNLCENSIPETKAAKGIANPFAALVPKKLPTHEALVQAVYELALKLPTLTKQDRETLKGIKLTYGSGPDGVRGITYFKLWTKQTGKGREKKAAILPFVAVCATGQSDHIQVIGTTLHELGHVIAGLQAGHGPEWHAACARLGLVDVKAAGTEYSPANFIEAGGFRAALLKLPKPQDGAPIAPGKGGQLPPDILGLLGKLGLSGVPTLKPRSCTAGWGTKGGKSRGKGSGSRLLLYTCGCTKVRASAGADFQATCGKCNKPFALADGEPPAAPVEPPKGGKGKAAKKPLPGPGKPKKGSKPVTPAGFAKAVSKPSSQPKAAPRNGSLKGKAAAARALAVNAPLPQPQAAGAAGAAKQPGGDPLIDILNRIDPKP